MKQSVFQKVYLGLILLLMYVPMLLVVVYSFNKSNITTVWSGFSFSWYGELFADREMAEALKNSLIIAVITSVAAAFLGTLCAVGIYKGRTVLDRGVKRLASVPLMMPEIITGILFLLIFSALEGALSSLMKAQRTRHVTWEQVKSAPFLKLPCLSLCRE